MSAQTTSPTASTLSVGSRVGVGGVVAEEDERVRSRGALVAQEALDPHVELPLRDPRPQEAPKANAIRPLDEGAGAADRLDLVLVLARAQVGDDAPGGTKLESATAKRRRAGEDDVVLLDADPAGAAEQSGELRQTVGGRVVGDDARAQPEHRAIWPGSSFGTRTPPPSLCRHDDGEEPLELQRPEARQVGDRLVRGRDECVEAGAPRPLLAATRSAPPRRRAVASVRRGHDSPPPTP